MRGFISHLTTAMKSERRDFPVHYLATAPGESRPLLAKTEKAFGMIPNLERTMAEAPVLLEGYGQLWESFGKSSFSAIEQQVVMQAVNVRHACDY
ncbi:hypothetical protein QEH58_14600 [Roseibacillus persicicus]|nr:hypothetical protein [Roseibacillus persicicus]